MGSPPPIVDLSRSFAFRATHQAPGDAAHEDAFELVLTVTGPLDDDGKVLDLGKLAAAAEVVLKRLRGADLTAALGLRTIGEIAIWIWGEVSIWVPSLREVELRDGACWARHRGERS